MHSHERLLIVFCSLGQVTQVDQVGCVNLRALR